MAFLLHRMVCALGTPQWYFAWLDLDLHLVWGKMAGVGPQELSRCSLQGMRPATKDANPI